MSGPERPRFITWCYNVMIVSTVGMTTAFVLLESHVVAAAMGVLSILLVAVRVVGSAWFRRLRSRQNESSS